jgi:hypothetical protein
MPIRGGNITVLYVIKNIFIFGGITIFVLVTILVEIGKGLKDKWRGKYRKSINKKKGMSNA